MFQQATVCSAAASSSQLLDLQNAQIIPAFSFSDEISLKRKSKNARMKWFLWFWIARIQKQCKNNFHVTVSSIFYSAQKKTKKKKQTFIQNLARSSYAWSILWLDHTGNNQWTPAPFLSWIFFLVIFQVPIHYQCEDYGENNRAQMNLDPLFSSRELQEIDGRPKTWAENLLNCMSTPSKHIHS